MTNIFNVPAHETMLASLQQWGFICGPRDERLNTNYPGCWMVVEEEYELLELPTKDGSNGPWCIVGDSFSDLVKQAWQVWVDEYEDQTRRALEVAELCSTTSLKG